MNEWVSSADTKHAFFVDSHEWRCSHTAIGLVPHNTTYSKENKDKMEKACIETVSTGVVI